MTFENRLDQMLLQELDYIREYVERVFGRELSQDEFTRQIEAIIAQKIEAYIFQRYRDWTAPQLALLLRHWPAEAAEVAEPVSEPTQALQGEPEPLKRKRGRPAKVN